MVSPIPIYKGKELTMDELLKLDMEIELGNAPLRTQCSGTWRFGEHRKGKQGK